MTSSLEQSLSFLHEPLYSVQWYIDHMKPNVRDFFYNMCHSTLERVEKYKACDQKGNTWWEGKTAKTSGSMGAAEVGHNVLQVPTVFLQSCVDEFGNDKNDTETTVAPKKKQNKFMEEGIRMEATARDDYLEQCKADLDLVWSTFGVFVNSVTEQGYIWLRGHQIILVKKQDTWQKPIIEIKETGVLIDKQMPWRCASLDGTVYINGIARWIVEIKCPREGILYPLWKIYYMDQVQNNLHSAKQHYSDVTFCDVWIYSEEHGGACICFDYDPHYFWSWYLPRECRFYFTKLLPGYAAKKQLQPSQQEKKEQKGDQKWKQFTVLKFMKPPVVETTTTSKIKFKICSAEEDSFMDHSELHQKRKFKAVTFTNTPELKKVKQ